MSRAYFDCGHYKVIYPEDAIVVGDEEYCDECKQPCKVTYLPDGDQGMKVTLEQADITYLKIAIETYLSIDQIEDIGYRVEQKKALLEKLRKLEPIAPIEIVRGSDNE